ncbi:hypothetical protein WJX73_007549 [Symbiochloris irregularis]|uniref:Protein kinase domain-containing protein n=1 Tax=Symbiochloris irregularis TaxID=706552 RepID=A0AAW1PMA4_9CHLO
MSAALSYEERVELVRAVRKIHAAGILHRDLHCDAVMRVPNTRHFRIVDFSSAIVEPSQGDCRHELLWFAKLLAVREGDL